MIRASETGNDALFRSKAMTYYGRWTYKIRKPCVRAPPLR